MQNILNKINANLHKVMPFPAIILLSVFFIYPFFRGIFISLTDWNGISTPNFIGIDNFIKFFKDVRALNDVKNTIQFGFFSTLFLTAAGLIYALILNESTKNNAIVRTIIYLPSIISPLIIGYVWMFILQGNHGVLYQILSSAGLEHIYKNVLEDVDIAMWAIIIINVWQFVGVPMIIFMAGLKIMPIEYFEAGKIDGAGYFASLRHITIPLLIPSIKINVITNTIYSLAVFDVIMALTEGGPGHATESLSIFIMRMSFSNFTGYAIAVALILFLIILVPVSIYVKILKTKEA